MGLLYIGNQIAFFSSATVSFQLLDQPEGRRRIKEKSSSPTRAQAERGKKKKKVDKFNLRVYLKLPYLVHNEIKTLTPNKEFST